MKIKLITIGIAVIAVVSIFLISKQVKFPKCGNYWCEEGETQENCCLDCGCSIGYECENNSCIHVFTCGNGICEEGEDCMYICPEDCKCRGDEYCSPSVLKCIKPECGNGICESEFENWTNCCLDCGCPLPTQICNLTSKRCEQLI